LLRLDLAAAARRDSCAVLLNRVDALAEVPPPLHPDAWPQLLTCAAELGRRALHGCAVCGSLLARSPGECRAEAVQHG